jgi:hypothetical protein
MNRLIQRVLVSVSMIAALLAGGLTVALPAHAASGKQHIVLTLQLDSMDKHEMDGGSTYGTMHFAGKGTWNGSPVKVQWDGAFTYMNGEGPWSAQITLITNDGAKAGIFFNARTTMKNSVAMFNGKTRFLGGTESLAGISGKGIMKGVRSGVLGSPLAITIDTSSNLPAPK